MADPLILVADANKTVTAVFREGILIAPPDTCGACGSGTGVVMIMALFGWLGLRLIGSRRLRVTDFRTR
jgi:hypothetical protein